MSLNIETTEDLKKFLRQRDRWPESKLYKAAVSYYYGYTPIISSDYDAKSENFLIMTRWQTPGTVVNMIEDMTKLSKAVRKAGARGGIMYTPGRMLDDSRYPGITHIKFGDARVLTTLAPLVKPQWELNYSDVLQYVENAQKLPSADTLQGQWCAKQCYNRGKIPQFRVDKLEAIPFWDWDYYPEPIQKQPQDLWLSSYRKLRIHMSIYKSVPTYSSSDLGVWCCKQRSIKRRGFMREENIRLLEAIPGWSWDHNNRNWDENYIDLVDYVLMYKRLPDHGTYLSEWCQNQRTNKKKAKLSKVRRNLLEKVPGWYWFKIDPTWDGWLDQIRFYTQMHGKFPDSSTELGRWCNKQRQLKNLITKEQTLSLESLPGWTWALEENKNTVIIVD